jgi:hypothetical protein
MFDTTSSATSFSKSAVEEINHAYDGGLYAELIRNRPFLDDAASPAHWSAVHDEGAESPSRSTRSATEPLVPRTGASPPSAAWSLLPPASDAS